jgi:predicted dinucleotide-binding enzyme
MAVKKTIAIIASEEEVALAIAHKLAQGNYRILLVSKEKNLLDQQLSDLKKNVPNADVELLDCMKDGCWEADIIILSIQPESENVVAELIKQVATQKIVVSFSNQEKNIDGQVERLKNLLPHSKVVMAFNTLKSLKIFIESDDNESVQTVAKILETAGYHPSILNGKSSAIKTL